MVFKPKMQEGRVFQDGEQMKIWISEDRNRLLVKVEAKINKSVFAKWLVKSLCGTAPRYFMNLCCGSIDCIVLCSTFKAEGFAEPIITSCKLILAFRNKAIASATCH